MSQIDLFSGRSAAAAKLLSSSSSAQNYRLKGDRALKETWRERAQDNVTAVKVARAIERQQRAATPGEQAFLARFVGFGASEIANSVFPVRGQSCKAGYEKIVSDLLAATSPQEWAALSRSTQYSHFTPEFVIRAIWQAVRRFGFRGGEVLEPGCGTGLFWSLMPDEFAVSSLLTGIEADPVTARIARLLHPRADIRQMDFTTPELRLPPQSLAIGNPPFSDRHVRTAASATTGMALHEFFVWRSIKSLAPGGLAAFVVSRYLMDKPNSVCRDRISDDADFLGAIRLPAGALRSAAGTDVVVDLIFLRRRQGAAEIGGESWQAVLPSPEAAIGYDPLINAYWLRRPEMVLGHHTVVSGQYGLAYSCRGRPEADLKVDLSIAVERLGKPPEEQDALSLTVKPPETVSGPAEPIHSVRIGNALDASPASREGSYFLAPGTGELCQVINGVGRKVAVKSGRGTEGMFASHAAIIRDMLPIRAAIRDVLRAQVEDCPWESAQVRLGDAYDTFIHRHGPINKLVVTKTEAENGDLKERSRRPNITPMMDDPDCFLIASIEEYDPATKIATRGPIFTRRVISSLPEMVIHTAADALAVTLNEMGRVDIERIAALLGSTIRQAVDSLGDAVYFDPRENEWQTDDAYLSGQVRDKLRDAIAAAATDPEAYQRNVVALTAVQPADLAPHEITARLGVPWIEPRDVMQFVIDVIGVTAPINYVPEISSWTVELQHFSGAAARSVWGTPQRHAGQLLDDGLNNRSPQVYRTVGKDLVEIDPAGTEAAKEKLAAIKGAFSEWVWKDTVRATRIAAHYNLLFNNLVPRSFSGKHLILPGASTVITPRDHQRRAGWRIVSSGDTYLAHTVGAGKTMALAIAIMEQRRLGFVSKPVLVVPSHCLAQFSREFLQLYPAARILVADEENFKKQKRQRFLARAATGEWDCIIITHSAFQFIVVPIEFERGIIQDQLKSYEDMTGKINASDRVSRKRLERLKEGLEARLSSLSYRRDGLTIEEIGIDQILVDEAQEFRKLSFATNMASLRGIDPNGSQRAWDLFLKARFIARKQPRRSLVLSSGTPITNTMGELYTLARFMSPDLLEQRGVSEFDAWAATFGDTRTELELQASGLYKPVTRFSQFVNVPELIAMFRSIADVVQKDDLREYVKLPRVKGGQREVITRAGSDVFREYQTRLAERIEEIAARRGPPVKGQDIILSVIGDGRHAALDMRLVGHPFDEPDNKLNALIATAFEIWEETSTVVYTQPGGKAYDKPGALQMIFSDIGTLAAENNRGFSAYAWIRERLVALGVPAAQIAIMQDYNTSVAKQRLFDSCNAGEVRFLLGSSKTMGTGVNVQTRLKALHHLDVPWLPSEIEQREGRAERQGNQNEEIRIIAYATLGSLDASMWQTNERKAKFIAAVMSGDTSIRTLQDMEADQAGQFALAKAIASGDSRLMQKAGLEADIARLYRQLDAHERDQWSIRHQVENARATIAEGLYIIPRLEADIAACTPSDDPSVFTLEGDAFEAWDAAGQALTGILRKAERAREIVECREIGRLSGFTLTMTVSISEDEIQGADGIMRKFDVSVELATSAQLYVYHLRSNTSGEGMISKMRGKLTGMADLLDDWRGRVERQQKHLSDYEPRLGRPFPHEADLAEKRDAMRKLDIELAATKKPKEVTP